MSALIALGAVAAALVLTAVAQWVTAETTGPRMQEWRNRW